MITSKSNELIKRIAALKEKKGRREQGAYLVEGVKQVREALAGGVPVERIVLSERYGGAPFAFPQERQTLVSEAVFSKLSEEVAPQGVLAVLPVSPCAPVAPAGIVKFSVTRSGPVTAVTLASVPGLDVVVVPT